MAARLFLHFTKASLAGLGFLLAICNTADSQAFPSLEVQSYVGEKVSSVDIAGRPDLSFDSVAKEIAIEPNKPLDQHDVDATIAALKHESGVRDVRVDLQ